MKQHFFKITRKVIGLALCGILLTISAPTFAKNNKQEIKPVLNIQPSLQYLSFEDQTSLFRVQFEPKAPVKFELSITDSHGNTLFHQNYESASFSKVFKLVNEGEENALDLSFSILLEDGTRHDFTVSNSSELANIVEITRL